MDMPPQMHVFSLDDDFEKDWREGEATGNLFKASGTINEENNLLNDYLKLQNYLMWRRLAEKYPTTLLDENGHPLMQEVYAVRHVNRELALRITKEYECVTSEGSTEKTDAEFVQRFQEIYSETPKPVFYYKMCPEDYFLLYDTPLLLYLYFQNKHQTAIHRIQAAECPLCYHSIYEDTPERQWETGWFGITIQRRKPRDGGNVLCVPAFCEKGRLEAFQRFIAQRKAVKRVHMFPYFTRCLSNHKQLEDVPDFKDEDAWYYEMCTGLALVTEISALLTDLGMKPNSGTNRTSFISWNDCRLKVFGKLLQDHRESIIRCPAIYWRIASLRDVIRHVDSCCSIKQLRWERQIKLAYTEEPGVIYPRSENDWYIFAKEQFEKHFFMHLNSIGITRESFSVQQIYQMIHFNYESHDTNPDCTEFMYAAKNLGKQYLLNMYVERITGGIMSKAVIDTYTAAKENTGFYFLGCLPKNDPTVEKYILNARIPLYKNNWKKPSMKKIRNSNKEEVIFEIIHKILYGTETDDDLGFLQLEYNNTNN